MTPPMAALPNGTVSPLFLDPDAQAGALAGLLARLGFTATVLTGRDRREHPCVAVDGGPDRTAAAGYVHAGPDQYGRQWFWLAFPGGPLEPVAPISEVSHAADAVSRALARAAGQDQAPPRTRAGQTGQSAATAA